MGVGAVIDGDRGGRDRDGRTRAYLRLSHMGLQFALTIGVAAGAGWWLDRRWDWGGLLTLAGVLAGFGVALFNLHREVYGGRG
ncbi:MAG: AtpZ/AtpI family protein [Planctomycetes bacterium]|nr:AtpZ/AtpI family protein [Planctomycetota bacterium]